MMVDINRCLLLTTNAAKRFDHKERFATLLQDLLKVYPAQFDRELSHRTLIGKELAVFCQQKSNDSGLSLL